MRLSEIWRLWDKFWFSQGSSLPICIFRILLGLLVLQIHIISAGNWTTFYTDHGILTMTTCCQYLGAPCVNLLTLIYPYDDATVLGFMVILILAAISFTAGFCTRLSTIAVYLMVTTLDHRNPLILNGGDTFIRCCLFWMLFAPAGELLSVDRWLKLKRGEKLADDPPRSIWPMRLLQLQVTAVYVQCFWSKTFGTTWLDGTALYYVLHQHEYLRFPLPISTDNIWVSRILTWGALTVEFALWALIWIKEFRYYVLAAGLVLHLGIEYSMNIPVFEQAMIASFVLFVDPNDLRAVMTRLRFFGRKSHSNNNVIAG